MNTDDEDEVSFERMSDVEYFQRNLFRALKIPREFLRQANCPHKNTEARGSGFTVFEDEDDPLCVQEHLWIPGALVTCLDCDKCWTSDYAEKMLAETEARLRQPPKPNWRESVRDWLFGDDDE